MTTFYKVNMYREATGEHGNYLESDLICTHYITGTRRAKAIFYNKFGRYMFFKKGDKAISYKMYTMEIVELDKKLKTQFFC